MKVLCLPATLSLALLLASCSLMTPSADTPAEPPASEEQTKPASRATENTEAAPLPTEEQQVAAAQLLNEQATENTATDNIPAEAPAAPEYVEPASPALPSGGLRMGSIIPQEDPASVGDAPPPTANSAERFGLRSPKIPSQLPMNIDGKIQSN